LYTTEYKSYVPYNWETRKKYMDLPFSLREYHNRLEKIEREMDRDSIDTLLVFGRMHDCGDLVYISNFIPFGRAVVIIRKGIEPVIITDAILHGEPINSYAWMTWIKDFRPVHHDESEFSSEILNVLKSEKSKRLGIVGRDQMPVSVYEALLRFKIEFVDFWHPFTKVKSLRSSAEVSLLREIGRITADGMKSAIEMISQGKTEHRIVATANKTMFEEGAHELAFSTIVNTGPKSGVKHSYPTNRKIARGDMIYLDMGAMKYGYNSDMSRTVVVGGANSDQKHVLDAVLNAYNVLTKMMIPGVRTAEIISKSEVLESASGLREEFPGRIFLGFAVHHAIATSFAEFPSQGFSDTTLKENMSFAFEPMAHILDFGTAVIEDIILIGKNGAESLTKYEKVHW
jgi:Xaa-Pro aminopeptidase